MPPPDSTRAIGPYPEATTAYSPVLRWAGSKKRSLGAIAPFLPRKIDRYLEVFAGSACLFFHLAPDDGVISDNNVELVKFYRTLAKHPRAVYRDFRSIKRNSRVYYRVRSIYANERDPIKRAAYFFYLNRNCFNGIYRTNANGEFNVPFSDRRVPHYPSEDSVVSASDLLRHSEIYCEDFEAVCSASAGKGDLVYLDPPYYVPAKRVFREYSSLPFSFADFKRLGRTLRSLDRRGIRFLLSYPSCVAAAKLADRWNCRKITVRRTIAGNSHSRRRAQELLIFNYDQHNE